MQIEQGTIYLSPSNTPEEKFKDGGRVIVIFKNSYLQIIVESHIERLNTESELWEDAYIYQDNILLKRDIGGIDLIFMEETENYAVVFNSSSGQLNVFLENKEDARTLRKYALAWLIK